VTTDGFLSGANGSTLRRSRRHYRTSFVVRRSGAFGEFDTVNDHEKVDPFVVTDIE
jgi:hypothetical protein